MSAERRFYVLQPYQQVKDLRTGITSGNPTTILDEFLQASLAQRWVARRRGEGSGGGLTPVKSGGLRE